MRKVMKCCVRVGLPIPVLERPAGPHGKRTTPDNKAAFTAYDETPARAGHPPPTHTK